MIQKAGLLLINMGLAVSLFGQQTHGLGALLRANEYPGGDAGSKIQACIAALPANGGTCDARGIEGAPTISSDPFQGVTKSGVLILGAGTYNVSATINVPANWTIQGAYGGNRLETRAVNLGGTVLSWKGSSNGTVLRIFDAYHVDVRDLSIDGNLTPGTTGILIDSDSHPATHNIVVENFTIYRCFVGIQWGTGNGNQADKVLIYNGIIQSWMPDSSGIVVQGANKGQESKIEAVTMVSVDTGIDLSGVPSYFTIKECGFGTPVTPGREDPAIKAVGAENLIIESGSSESGPPSGHGQVARVFIHYLASPYNVGSVATVLINTKVNEPIIIEGGKLLSVGYTEGTREPAPIFNIRRGRGVVNVTTSKPHRMAPGGFAIISGVRDSSFNGAFRVQSVSDTTHFTYAQDGPPAAESSGTALDSLAVVSGTARVNVTSIGDYLNNGQGWTVVGTPNVLKLQENSSSFPGEVNVKGPLHASTVFATKYNTGGADYAEAVQASPSKEAYVPGEVFVIDPASPSAFALSREPYSMRVAGVYSTHPGIFAEGEPQRIPSKSLKIPLAIVGIVPCLVSAENGPIAPGDLLVTSSSPGYAMKGTDRNRMVGAVVGKALERMAEGKGTIRVLLTPQ